jgi:hypothetical protein
VSLRVIRNTFPEQSKNHEVSMLAMDARPAKLNHLIPNRLENLEFKFLRAVVTQMRRGVPAGLQTVSAHNFTSGQMLDDEMIANSIKRIFIEPGSMGLFESFIKFEVEDFIAQRLGGPHFPEMDREARCVLDWRSNE